MGYVCHWEWLLPLQGSKIKGGEFCRRREKRAKKEIEKKKSLLLLCRVNLKIKLFYTFFFCWISSLFLILYGGKEKRKNVPFLFFREKEIKNKKRFPRGYMESPKEQKMIFFAQSELWFQLNFIWTPNRWWQNALSSTRSSKFIFFRNGLSESF